MGAVQREVEVGVEAARRPHLQQPAAVGQPVAGAGEVDAPRPHRGRGPVPEDRGQLGVGLAQYQGRAGLDDPRLLPGDVGPGRPDHLGVVEGDVGDDGDDPVGHVRAVPAAAEPDLDHGRVGGHVREPTERGRGEDVEVRRRRRQHRLHQRHRLDDLGQVAVGDRLAVPGKPLVDVKYLDCRVSGASVRDAQGPLRVGTASSPRSDAAVRPRRSLSRRLPPANNR